MKFISTPPIITRSRWYRRLRAELPRLGRLFHLFGVHRLVYHTRDFAISSQRQPAYAVLRIAMFGLVLEQGKPRVEENIKLLHPYLKEAGKRKSVLPRAQSLKVKG